MYLDWLVGGLHDDLNLPPLQEFSFTLKFLCYHEDSRTIGTICHTKKWAKHSGIGSIYDIIK